MEKIHYNENINIFYKCINELKKRSKNVLDAIPFTGSITLHHTPKITDRSEISTIWIPKEHRYVIKKFLYSKKFWNLPLFWFYFEVQGVRNFWPISDFWGMMLSDANCKKNRIQNIFRVFFMCKNGKRMIFEHSKIIKFYVIKFVFCVPGGCTYPECHLRDLKWQLWTITFLTRC